MKKIIIMSMSILFLSKCVDPINLINDENAKTVLVIDAKMIKYKETGRILVDLIQSSFNTDRSFAFIADEVSVINSAGNKLVLNRYAIGRYSANETASFKFTYGQKYKIRVFNNNGDTYESSFEELYPSPSIQKTSFKYEPGVKEGLSLSVNTTLNNENKNKILKWDLFQVFKMTEQKFGGPNLRTCYTIVQQAIDKKAQSYFIAYTTLSKEKEIYLIIIQKCQSGEAFILEIIFWH
jgi:hypothetical protein